MIRSLQRLSRQDIEELWSEFGASPEKFSYAITSFRSHLESLGRALEQMDLEKIQVDCREVQQLSRHFGAYELHEILSELQEAAALRDGARVREIKLRCEEEMIEVMAELSDFLRFKQAA